MLICLHYTAGNASPSLFPAHKRKMTTPSTLLLPLHSSSLPMGGGIMLKLKSGAFQNYKIKKGGVNGTWYIQPHYLFLNFVQTCIFLPSLNFICIQPRPSTKLCSP